MSKANCDLPESDLSALIDGELTDARAASVREHVASCGHCAETLARFQQAGSMLAALPERPVPGDLRARLQARMDAEVGAAADRITPDAGVTHRTHERTRRAAPSVRRRWLGSPVLAACASIAAAVALYFALVRGDAATPGRAPEIPKLAREAPNPLPLDPTPDLKPAPPIHEIAVDETLAVAPGVAPDRDFDLVPEEEIAVALELETIEDLDVIANLELLQALVALDEGTG